MAEDEKVNKPRFAAKRHGLVKGFVLFTRALLFCHLSLFLQLL
nr:MAG TPA: hypothetical protein [Caudoviricetes sp.]